MKPAKILLRISSIKAFFALFLFLPVICNLPCAYASPRATITLEHTRISLKKSFDVVITVAWQGNADDYIIVPPQPDYPEKILQQSSSFFSSTSHATYALSYRYSLVAQEKGTFTINPVEIKYWSKGSDKESTLLTDEVSFEVVTFAFWNDTVQLVAISLAVLITAGIIITAIIRKKRGGSPEQHGLADKSPHSRHQSAVNKLEECRQSKIKGDYQGFYQCALAVVKNLEPEDGSFCDTLAAAAEKVHFGGYRPTAQETDMLLRKIEKMVAAATSDKAALEREYAQYCE